MSVTILSVLVVASCIAASIAQPLSSAEATAQWENFKGSFGKSYGNSEEEQYRRQVFQNNVQIINEHNKLYEQGKTTFTMKINKFADLKPEEIKRHMNGFKSDLKTPSREVYRASANEELPKSVDWRTKGAVTPVKNQAQCGSCWAFSATGSLEGQTFLKKGKLVSLSEQNLMDCSGAEGNNGCEGGLMDSAFEYIKENGGIDTEASYPYEAQDDSCKFKKSSVGATLIGFADIEAGSEKSLQSAVANIGPISVAIDAGQMSFQFYDSGVYYESSCSSNQLDHGVLAVGYGTDKQGDYWIVKNSWGATWGENGYIRMSRNKNNNCGIATMASYPKV